MTGELEGVAADFQAYVDWARSARRPNDRIVRRKSWIEQLDSGANPFSRPNRTRLLKELRDE